MRLSSSARRVLDHVKERGIEFAAHSDLFLLEQTCVRFYPNHIIGVIDSVLINENRIERCRSQGWSYLDKPIHSMLAKREGALRGSITDSDLRLRNYVQIASFLETDMTDDEARILFHDLPPLISSTEMLRAGIEACRRAQARSVYYLHGVLRREAQKKESRRQELLDSRSTVDPWTPADYHAPTDEQIDKMSSRWAEKDSDIDLIKDE